MPFQPKIVFIGTPAFAAAQLRMLVREKCMVAAVVTAPDCPAGRGLQPQPSAVKLCAQQFGIPILQPENLRSTAFLAELRTFAADIFVVVAFRMLPEEVWRMPPLGTFNLHASLLPNYRGAAPINWSIINGETETGVTTFLLDRTMDTGNILLQKSIPISSSDNAATLHDKLSSLGEIVILETINGLATKKIVPQPQTIVAELKTAPKLFKHNTRLNPALSAVRAADFVRGLSPMPAAWIAVQIGTLPPQILKIFAATPTTDTADVPIGTLIQENATLLLRCADSFLSLKELQLQGKKRMSTPDFLRGLRGKIQLSYV